MTASDLENETKNQHFISQAEQRLNALNPSALPENQEIYEFEVIDRDKPILGPPRKRLIQRNLAQHDLFSFDVGPGAARLNFERLFQDYESDLPRNSLSFLEKLARHDGDIESEVVDVFGAKLLNFMRNPCSVKKVSNTIGDVAKWVPHDPELRRTRELVLLGNKPHRDYVCKTFGLEPDVYDRWLATLFALFVRAPESSHSLYVDVVKAFFEPNQGQVLVYRYSGNDPRNVCLLSDRGFNVPVQDEWIFASNSTSRVRRSRRFASWIPAST